MKNYRFNLLALVILLPIALFGGACASDGLPPSVPSYPDSLVISGSR